MNVRASAGFTIIETVLFLAVTGLLVLGVLVGVGTSLNNQRYRDATETLKNIVQVQYAELSSTKNNRPNTITCAGGAVITDEGNEIRGQSNCVVVGRYMILEGSNIDIYTVLARHTGSTAPQNTDDIATLRNYYNYTVTSEVERRTTEWQTSVGHPKEGRGAQANAPTGIALLFIRSPETGGIYTFTGNTTSVHDEAIRTLMSVGGTTPGQGQGERTLCVQSDNLFVGGDAAVYITPYAKGASAVELRSNATSLSLGGTGAARC